MAKISVAIITQNEAAHIGPALESVAWADERIVVDSGSSDETVGIARTMAERVETRAWEGYAEQKNYAASLATHEWVLSLDADERVSPPLADEIRSVLTDGTSRGGFQMPRVSYYLGRWVRSTDWWPDWQLRLYDRRVASWTRVAVHESVRTSAPVGRLHGELLHYPYRDVTDHLMTIDRYTTLAAHQMREHGRRAGWLRIVGHPALAFLRNYVIRGGFRQGTTGLIVSLLNSYYVLLKFVKLWELQQAHEASAPPLLQPGDPGDR